MIVGIATTSVEYYTTYKTELEKYLPNARFQLLEANDFAVMGRIDNMSLDIILLDTLSKEILSQDSVLSIIELSGKSLIFLENKISELTELSSTGYYLVLAKKILRYCSAESNLIVQPVSNSCCDRLVVICGGVGATESLKLIAKNVVKNKTSVMVLQQSNETGINSVISMLQKVSSASVISLSQDVKIRSGHIYVAHPNYETEINDFGVLLPIEKENMNNGYLSLNSTLKRIFETSRNMIFDVVILSGMEGDIVESIQFHKNKIRTIITESKPVVDIMTKAVLDKEVSAITLKPEDIIGYIYKLKNVTPTSADEKVVI
jgi:chemotaxis response regulator CheB